MIYKLYIYKKIIYKRNLKIFIPPKFKSLLEPNNYIIIYILKILIEI